MNILLSFLLLSVVYAAEQQEIKETKEIKEIQQEQKQHTYGLIDNLVDQFINGGRLETHIELLEKLVNQQEAIIERETYLENRRKSLQIEEKKEKDDEIEMKSMLRKYKQNHKLILQLLGDMKDTDNGVDENDKVILKNRELKHKKHEFSFHFIIEFIQEVVVYFFKCLGISFLFLIFLILFLWLVEAIRDRDLKKDNQKTE